MTLTDTKWLLNDVMDQCNMIREDLRCQWALSCTYSDQKVHKFQRTKNVIIYAYNTLYMAK